MPQVLGLTVEITAANADEVIAKLKALGATAGGETKQGVGELDRTLGDLKGTLLGLVGLGGIVESLKTLAEAGIEASDATRLLNFSMEKAGVDLRVYGDQIHAAVEATSALGLSTEAQTTSALQRLTLITGDANWSLQHLSTAQDLAAATGVDLTTAAIELGRAYNGVWIQLQRAGLVTKDTQDKMDTLIRKVSGASQQMTEGAGLWHKILTSFKDDIEHVGEAALNALAKVHRFFLATGLEKEAPMSLPPLTVSMPPNTPGMGVSVTARQKSPEEARLAFLEYQKQGLEIQLKETKDLGERLRILNDIADLDQKINEYLKKANELSAAQQFYADRIRAAIEGAVKAEERLKDVNQPLADIINPKLSPTAGQYNNPDAFGTQQHLPFDFGITQWYNALKAQQQRIKDAAIDIGSAIYDGVETGMTRKKGGLGAAFLAMTADVLRGLGEMIMRMAGPIAVFGKLMLALQEAITSNPIFAGAVAIVVAAALTALASSLSASASGSSSGGSGSFRMSNLSGVSMTQYLTPSPGTPFAAGHPYPGGVMQPVFNIFGPNDPTVQRSLAQAMQNVARRNFRTS